MKAAGIIFSNLNNNTLSKLTEDRTVAAIPFACRYRLVDFALSNMVNARISNINVVTNYNYRSLMEHIGSGKDWDLARRSGGIHVISPFQTSHTPNAKIYSSHMEALRSISDSYIRNMREDYVVLSDCDFICNIDLSAVIREHDSTGADVTFVTVATEEEFTSATPKTMVAADADGRITKVEMCTRYNEVCPEISTNIFVFKTQYLRQILEEAEREDYKSLTQDFLIRKAGTDHYRVYRYDGYFAMVSNFRDYFACSIALAEDPVKRRSLLGIESRPVYTKVHNSPPTVYKDTACVKSSLIADGCVIEGTVENSIIFRDVKIKKGAVVKDSVLFFGTEVGEGTTLNCVVADKHTTVSDGLTLSGHKTIPFYIAKGQKV